MKQIHIFALLFFLFSFNAFSAGDEIQPINTGIADFPNDPANMFDPAANVSGFCAGMRSRRDVDSWKGTCPTEVSSGTLPSTWECSSKAQASNGDCYDSVAGTDTWSNVRTYAQCPEFFHLKTDGIKRGELEFPHPNSEGPGPLYQQMDNPSGVCIRCMAPFSWDSGEKACVMECAANETFNTKLGICEPKINYVQNEMCDEFDGNPIYAKTGEKRQTERPDYTGGGAFPIVFARNYRSYRAPNAPKRSGFSANAPVVRFYQPIGTAYLGIRRDYGWNISTAQIDVHSGKRQWAHSYDAMLQMVGSSDEEVVLLRPDGEKRHFYFNRGLYKPRSPGKDALYRSNRTDPARHWDYYTAEGTLEVYDNDGLLRQIISSQGHVKTLNYNMSQQLIGIVDDAGRTLTLEYAGVMLDALVFPDGNRVEYSYDSIGNLTVVTFPDGDADATNNPSEGYLYSDPNNPFLLTGKIDASGNQIASWVYDADGRAIESRHINNNDRTYFEYTDTYTKITKDNGYEKTLNYDNGRLTSVIGASCASDGTKGTTSFAYNTYGVLTEITHPDNSKTTIGGSVGISEDVREGYVSSSNFARRMQTETVSKFATRFRLPSKTTDANYMNELFTYNTNGQITEYATQVFGVKRKTTFAYNGNNRLGSINGAREDLTGTEDITSFTYYPNGDVHKIINAYGHEVEVLSYDANGYPTHIQYPNGDSVYSVYDVRGDLIEQENSGVRTFFTYDGNRNLVSSSNVYGSLTYGYDNDNRLTSITDEGGNTIGFVLDSYGNQTSVSISGVSGVVSAFTQTFDAQNRLSSFTSADSQSTVFEYDVVDNLVKSTNPLSHEVEFAYDAVNRLTTDTDELDGNISMTYSKTDKLTSVTDQTNRTTTYYHNRYGDLENISSPDSGTTRFTHDKAGNVITKKDASNVTVTYAYDALNRLVSESYPNTVNNITYEYDGNAAGQHGIGRLTKVTTSDVVTEYFYDSYGHMLSESRTLNSNGVSSTGSVTYAYSNNLLSSITYPSGLAINYSYDGDQVSGVTATVTELDGSQTTTNLVSNIQYLPFGPLSSMTFGNGKVLTNTFDADFQLTGRTLPGVYDYDYTANAINDITRIDNNTVVEQSFSYDAAQRLTDATGVYGDIDFALNGIGDRTSLTIDGATSTYSYSNQMTSNGSQSYTYNVNGSLTNRGSDSFTYNQRNEMVSATVATVVTNYARDHLKRRVLKSSSSVTEQYYYDNGANVISVTDASNNAEIEYVYVNGLRVVAKIGSDFYYIHTNHLDAPVALTDNTGTVVWSTDYTPFGGTVNLVNSLTVEINLRLPGQYFDAETGFYYNYFRDYDPELGRYIQSDPIGLAGGVNTYGYVKGNPIMYVDPEGLLSFNFDQFANQIRDNRSSTASSLAALGSTFTFGTLPKTPPELRGLGVSKQKLNPYTSQLSRWNGRLNRYTGVRTRALRNLGRSRVGIVSGTMATAGLIFDGFYNWGVILMAAYDATSFDDRDDNMLIETCN